MLFSPDFTCGCIIGILAILLPSTVMVLLALIDAYHEIKDKP